MSTSDRATSDSSISQLTSLSESLYGDRDGDGIPDEDDSMESTPSSADFMASIDALNGAVDDVVAKMDELMQGLSCGFGG